MKTKCPLPKGFSGTQRVSGFFTGLLVLLLGAWSVAGAAPLAYVSNNADGTVSVIDVAPPSGCPIAGQSPPCVVATLKVGTSPSGVAVNPAGTFAYVANWGDDSVSVIRTSDNNVTTIQAVGFGPWGVAVSPDNSRVYVGLSDGSVTVIDANNSNVVTTIPAVGGVLNGIVAAGSRVYVSDATFGQVVVIDGPTLSVIGRIDVGSPPNSSPMGLVANPSGTRVYVADLGFDQVHLITVLEVSVIDTGSLAVVQTLVIDPDPLIISQPTDSTLATPGGVALSPDGSRLYVANDAVNQVTIITLSNGDRAYVAVGAARTWPFGIATDPTGLAYVANVPDSALQPQPPGSVSVIDPATNSVVKSVGVGRAPSVLGAFATAGPPPPQRFALTLTPVGGGSIAAQPTSGTGMYDAGTTVTLTATPDANSQFNAWSGDCSGSTNPCSVTMNAAKSVGATFTAQYALVLTALGDGSIAAVPAPGPLAGKYPAGTEVTPTATPGPSSVFTGWAGACSGSAISCKVTMDMAKSVTATFTAQYALVLTAIGNGSIAAVPAPGPLAGKYPAGTEVTLTATPGPNSVFSSWAGACSGSAPSCKVTMDAAKSVTATFTLKQFVLTLATVGSGTITANPQPVGGTYGAGTVVALTATPAAGYQFSGWSGACTGTGACSVTMDAAKSVTATFTLNQFVLTLTTVGSGTITASPQPVGGTYGAGTVVALTATPGAGYQFSGWSGACTGTGACGVTMNAAKSVTATFTLAPPPPAQFTLTLSTVGDGTIGAQPTAVGGQYNTGTLVGLTPKPGVGAKFHAWSGACTGNGACSVLMNASKNVTATFTPALLTTCDEKIKDLQGKVAGMKHPWWHDQQLKVSLKMYAESLAELNKASAKVGAGDKRIVHAQKEFNSGKGALCLGHYWRADHEFWETLVIANEILKPNRR